MAASAIVTSPGGPLGSEIAPSHRPVEEERKHKNGLFRRIYNLFRTQSHSKKDEHDQGGLISMKSKRWWKRKKEQSKLISKTQSQSVDNVSDLSAASRPANRTVTQSMENISVGPFRDELSSIFQRRPSLQSDDGLPVSISSSFTNADNVGRVLRRGSPAKTGSRESEKSLLSVDGSENEEDAFFTKKWMSSVVSVVQPTEGPLNNNKDSNVEIDFSAVERTDRLDINAAKHRLSVMPPPRRPPHWAHKHQRTSLPPVLPQVKEESMQGTSNTQSTSTTVSKHSTQVDETENSNQTQSDSQENNLSASKTEEKSQRKDSLTTKDIDTTKKDNLNVLEDEFVEAVSLKTVSSHSLVSPTSDGKSVSSMNSLLEFESANSSSSIEENKMLDENSAEVEIKSSDALKETSQPPISVKVPHNVAIPDKGADNLHKIGRVPKTQSATTQLGNVTRDSKSHISTDPSVKSPDSAGSVISPDHAGSVKPPDLAGSVKPPDRAGSVKPPDLAGSIKPPDPAGNVKPPDLAGSDKKSLMKENSDINQNVKVDDAKGLTGAGEQKDVYKSLGISDINISKVSDKAISSDTQIIGGSKSDLNENKVSSSPSATLPCKTSADNKNVKTYRRQTLPGHLSNQENTVDQHTVAPIRKVSTPVSNLHDRTSNKDVSCLKDKLKSGKLESSLVTKHKYPDINVDKAEKPTSFDKLPVSDSNQAPGSAVGITEDVYVSNIHAKSGDESTTNSEIANLQQPKLKPSYNIKTISSTIEEKKPSHTEVSNLRKKFSLDHTIGDLQADTGAKERKPIRRISEISSSVKFDSDISVQDDARKDKKPSQINENVEVNSKTTPTVDNIALPSQPSTISSTKTNFADTKTYNVNKKSSHGVFTASPKFSTPSNSCVTSKPETKVSSNEESISIEKTLNKSEANTDNAVKSQVSSISKKPDTNTDVGKPDHKVPTWRSNLKTRDASKSDANQQNVSNYSSKPIVKPNLTSEKDVSKGIATSMLKKTSVPSEASKDTRVSSNTTLDTQSKSVSNDIPDLPKRETTDISSNSTVKPSYLSKKPDIVRKPFPASNVSSVKKTINDKTSETASNVIAKPSKFPPAKKTDDFSKKEDDNKQISSSSKTESNLSVSGAAPEKRKSRVLEMVKNIEPS